jgi:hypothetical protein
MPTISASSPAPGVGPGEHRAVGRQVLLAVIFLLSGAAKLTMSPERMLATGQTGAAALPLPITRFTAACELLAVAGLILPGLFGVAQPLTGWAAMGLAVVMLGAMSKHAKLAVTEHRATEWRNALSNVALLLLCAFVAAGRILISMMRDAAVSLVDRLHKARNAFYAGGAGAAPRRFLGPDITWIVPDDTAIAGSYRGPHVVFAYFHRRSDLASSTFQISRRDILVGDDGDRIAACWLSRSTHARLTQFTPKYPPLGPNGDRYRMPMSGAVIPEGCPITLPSAEPGRRSSTNKWRCGNADGRTHYYQGSFGRRRHAAPCRRTVDDRSRA